MACLLALPYMFKTAVTTTSSSNSNDGSKNVTNETISLGRQNLNEVYSEYKIKGLINNNLPEFTLMELKAYLDTFAKNVVESFSKQNLVPLSNITTYSNTIAEYNRVIFAGDDTIEGSWRKQYLDMKGFFVLTDGTIFYQLKDAFLVDGKEYEVKEKLKGLIIKFNDKFLKFGAIPEKKEQKQLKSYLDCIKIRKNLNWSPNSNIKIGLSKIAKFIL
jgi:hypothetical protein